MTSAPLLVAALALAAVLLARRPRGRTRLALRRGSAGVPARGTAPGPRTARGGGRASTDGAGTVGAPRGIGAAARAVLARIADRLLPGSSGGRVDAGEVGALVGEVAALLRAGALPGDAWEQAGARRPRVAAAMAAGRDPAVGAATAGARAAVRLAADIGAPPAEVLDRTVGALVEAAAARTARETALAGPRASARLLGVLPLAGLALGFALGADPAGVLLDGGLGTVCLVAGVTLYVAGGRWVAHEVARARRTGDDP